MTRLKVGDHAPDMALLNGSGQEVTLAEHWQHGAVLLVFLRHFG
jgi:peroxiredoxin